MQCLSTLNLGMRRVVVALCLAAAVAASGCDPAPKPQPAGPEFAVNEWDMYVTRHMGRALGRMQFRVPPGWRVTYQHDTIHPKMILANRVDLKAADVSYMVIGLTEENVFLNKRFDGPPAVWNAADYSPEMDPVKRVNLDRKEIVELHKRMGQGVRWRSVLDPDTARVVGDWEYIWKHGVDPGPGAVDRDKQRVNKFDECLKNYPAAKVEYFREMYTLGWGLHQKAWLQIYYKANNDAIARQFDALIPTVDEYTYSEADVTLLGGPITKAAWDRLVQDNEKAMNLDTPPAQPAQPTAPAPAHP